MKNKNPTFFRVGSEICKACTNTSTAKYQYTFSKAERFPKPKTYEKTEKQEELEKKLNYKHQDYYLLPSTLNHRYTKFGYGNRSDFTQGAEKKAELSKSENLPLASPEKKNLHGPMYSFPNGREKYGKVYVESTKPFDKNIPGPAKYDILKKVSQDFGYDAPKISFGGLDPETRRKQLEKQLEKERQLIKEEKEKEKTSPSYKPKVTIQIRPSGKYAVSHIPNVNSLNFEKDKSKRTQFEANKNPGPSDYDKDNISLNKPLMGRLFPSKYRSHEAISISQKHYPKDSRSNYPGPGSYLIPSDFGIYLAPGSKYPEENVYMEPKKEDVDPRPWRHGMKIIKPKEENEDDYKNEEIQENPEQENKDEEQTPSPEDNNKEEEKKEEEKKEEEQKEEEQKEEDKESDVIMLRDILQYQNNES